MPISETPKNIEFIIIKLSAAELVIANNVAFIESDENYKWIFVFKNLIIYNTLLLNYINTRINIVLCY